MKKQYIRILSAIFGICFVLSTAQAVEAASLKFSPITTNSSAGSTFTVDVVVEPGTDQISSTDAIVTYDPTLVQATAVTPGTYFPSVTNTITSGKVTVRATVNNATDYKTGTGTIATITFSSLAGGTATLQYFCDTSSYNTSKIVKSDINATNIIVCSENGTGVVSISGGTSSVTPTANPNPLATPTPISQLPVTGVVEDVTRTGLVGGIMVLLGVLIKFKLKRI